MSRSPTRSSIGRMRRVGAARARVSSRDMAWPSRATHQWLGALRCKRMKEISGGKQGEAKNSARQIEVLTKAVLKAPVHPTQQVKCLRHVGKSNDHQTSRANEL